MRSPALKMIAVPCLFSVVLDCEKGAYALELPLVCWPCMYSPWVWHGLIAQSACPARSIGNALWHARCYLPVNHMHLTHVLLFMQVLAKILSSRMLAEVRSCVPYSCSSSECQNQPGGVPTRLSHLSKQALARL